MIKILQVIIIALFLFTGNGVAKNKEGNSKKNRGTESNSLSKTNEAISRTKFNINNISTWFVNNGSSDLSPYGNSGFVFPKGSGKTAIYESGLVWGATLNGEKRVGGSTYNHGLLPGRVIGTGTAAVREDESLEHVRIYRVRRNFIDIFAEINDDEGSEAEIIAQYEKDWNEWPAQYGAPYEDVDGDGNYNPVADIPGVIGAEQTIWYVANDLDTTICRGLYGSDPMGIEMQATFWGYNKPNELRNVIFRKYKIINKSTDVFDSMYVSMWADPDIGYAGDDFSGCDTALSLMYSYNGNEYDAVYGTKPPAIGFDFFQGPIVPGEATDTAIFNDQKISGFINLPMSSHYFFIGGAYDFRDPPLSDYSGTLYFHNLFRGRIPATGEPFRDPNTGLETKFTLAGDPIAGTGWNDGQLHIPDDRRQGMVAGPFTMAPGDTQEVVAAVIAAFGENNLDAITKLKEADYHIQEAYNDLLYFETAPIPPYVAANLIEDNSDVTITWEQSSETESYDNDGYQFQGYNVYQLPSWKKIKTFDIVDGVTTISQLVYDAELGYETMQEVQTGTDSGLEYEFKIEKDYIDDSKLLIGKPYYFGVTSYTYTSNDSKKIKTSEGRISVVELVYRDNDEGIKYGDILQVGHSDGEGNGSIKVTVIDRTALTGNDYEVFFDQRYYFLDSTGIWKETTASDSTNNFRIENHWNVKNTTTGNVVLEKQRVFNGIDQYADYWNVPSDVDEDTVKVIDGFRVTVSGSFDSPIGMQSAALNGIDLRLSNSSYNQRFNMTDYGMHGWAATGRAVDAFGNGTTDIDILQKDYELRFSGEYETSGVDSVYRIKDGTGSMATLYGARGYDIKDHPLNPNPGSSAPFLMRIPFEVWNIDDNRQVNLLVYDRMGDPSGKPFYCFNSFDRMYCYVNNTPYAADVVNSADTTNADTDNLTWNWIFWKTDWEKDDVVRIIYTNPLKIGVDKFAFNSFILTSIDENKIPNEYSLSQNYPNPFNPSTTIRYTLPSNEKRKTLDVKLIVFDILGREVVTLVNKVQKAGNYKVQFDANNLSSGVYLYRLQSGSFVKSRKMLLIK